MMQQERFALVQEFIAFCTSKLNIEQPPQIDFTMDRSWATGHRSFGAYKPESASLQVYIGNRNMADILRTLAHELVHHRQRELGKVESSKDGQAGSPIENEANAIAGVLMREFGKTHEDIYESRVPTLGKLLTEIEDEQPKKKSVGFTIYCDMDGVLSNFDGRFEDVFGVSPKQYKEDKGEGDFGKGLEAFNKAIDDKGEEFWSGMEWMPGGQQLWSVISKRNASLLTSPGKYAGAKEGKQTWAEANLNPPPQDIFFRRSGEKQTVLEGKSEEEIKRSILIDDMYKNIAGWKQAGGIGLYYKSADQILDILAKFKIK